MEMIIIATLGGLGGLLFWGLSDYFSGKSGQHSNVLLTNLVVQSIGLAILLPIVVWFGLPLKLNSALLLVVASATFFTIANIAFIKAMAIGPFGVAAPIGNSYALITLFAGIAFFELAFSTLQFFALIIIVLGVILLAIDRTTFDYKKLRGSTIFFALITMVSWGLAFVFVEPIVNQFAWHQLLFLLGIFIVLLSFVFYLVVYKTLPSWKILKYSSMPQAWKAGIFVVAGAISFFSASDYAGSVVIPAVIASASPLVTSFMAYIRDKERLALYKRVGAIIIVLGLILLNI